MKVAVNFSKEAEALLHKKSIEVDLFKCPDFSKELIFRAGKGKPCYVHFALNEGSGQMHQVNWKAIHELREHTQTPYINVHAVAYARDYPNVDILTTDTKHIRTMVDATVRDIDYLAKHVGTENIIVENVICRGKGENMMKPIIDPVILTEIINQTGCGFLLDTAHARMTSLSLGLEVQDYISQLPLSHLKELHITGIQPDETGRLRDSMPMTDKDWQLTEWVLRRIKKGDWATPWVVAFEYGGVGPAFEWRSDEEVLASQLPKLHQLVRKF
ncbi:DUF692 family multinuclear iron-containing protein [Ornithinibacillus scapharcae]|uniref:multinuclear nonheme iron-dependent oxidase n=1 Tax=Ornithinibacillus scapharcae TaxID=1147159 RepID=UPI000225BA17|nr:DUF692 family multinuclear iron-containing protein [Ornithinibacillus scapharcae]